MSRRLFLERIAALIGVGIGAPVAQAAVPERVELQCAQLAGFQYHNGETVWPLLTLGTPLDLVREPDNRYDQRAVRIDWQGQKLGYVPRIDNAAISHLLDNGQPVSAEIIGLQPSDNPWDRISLALYLAR